MEIKKYQSRFGRTNLRMTSIRYLIKLAFVHLTGYGFDSVMSESNSIVKE